MTILKDMWVISRKPGRAIGSFVDDKTRLGALSESKVIAKLIEAGIDVFVQFSGKSPFDLIGHKDGRLLKFQVKGTSSLTKYGSYRVLIASIRSNKTANRIVHFDPSICDVLAVYVEPLDKVYFFKSSAITTRKQLNIKPNLEGHNDILGILRDYTRDA